MYLALPVPMGKSKVVLQQLIDEFVKVEIMEGPEAWWVEFKYRTLAATDVSAGTAHGAKFLDGRRKRSRSLASPLCS
jgi:hypothetical protein